MSAPYGPHVQVVCVPADAPSSDLQVRVRDVTQPTGWRTAATFNDMSNDYAHSEARECAQNERRKLIEGEGK